MIFMKRVFFCRSSILLTPQYPMPERRPPTSCRTIEEMGLCTGRGPRCLRGPACRGFGFLTIAVTAALLHGSERAHAAICLKRAALIKDGFARAFIGSSKQGTDHDGVGTGGQGFREIAGKLNAAIRDERNAGLARGLRRNSEWR